MLNTKEFGNALKALGFNFFSGVPCSFLKDLINYAINDCDYIGAANEGDAVAIAAGAHLGGKKTVVLLQNSGLSNTLSPLTSLNYPFKIPILGFVSLRGEDGIQDEPQHELIGQITNTLLHTVKVKTAILSTDINIAKKQVQEANQHYLNNQSFFFIVKKGSFKEEPLKKHLSPSKKQGQHHPLFNTEDLSPSRIQALETLQSCRNENTLFLATTGKTGRELYECEDHAQQLYMVGSMGCISSLGLGLALSQPHKQIIVIDGDGSLLMRMGNLATIGHYSPPNLCHIILDNHSHDSTGGQDTVSHTCHFSKVAEYSGYSNSLHISNTKDLKTAIENWQHNPSLSCIHLKIQKGSKKDLGRPKMKPWEVKERFMNQAQSKNP